MAKSMICGRDGCHGRQVKHSPEGYCSKACTVLDREFEKLRAKILRARKRGRYERAAELDTAWLKLAEAADTFTEAKRLVDYTAVRGAE